MRRTQLIILGALAIAVLAVVIDGLYTVKETQQVVITQFGRPVGQAVKEPGLHMKVPFIQTGHFFDTRFLEWDGDPNQIPTKDKKFIHIDTYARWQIKDPLQFYKRMGNERSAQSRLDDILDGETRDAVASHDLVEIVRSTNRTPISDATISEIVKDTLADIEVGRDSIQVSVQQKANKTAEELGIIIHDFRIKRVNYVEDVRQQVYKRMRSERNRIASKFISEGRGESSRINGEKEHMLNQIRSEANRRAEEIKGEADAEAAAIYNESYAKSSSSRDLYDFLKTMETLQKTTDRNTSMILSTESDLYRYLKRLNP